MIYNQEIGKILKSNVEIDLHETGFDYTFTDKLLFGRPRVDRAFITYANISNQKDYIRRNHPDSKKIIFTLVGIFIACFVAVVLTSTSVVSGSPYEGYYNAGFYIALISVFLVYKFVAVQKVIKLTENKGLTFLLLNIDGAETVAQRIFEMRNKYLREKFIENNNYKTLTVELVEYLASLGVITKEEATQIKGEIRPITSTPVGFGVMEKQEN
jgi:hypothetical protein